jgi:hypothetical protein
MIAEIESATATTREQTMVKRTTSDKCTKRFAFPPDTNGLRRCNDGATQNAGILSRMGNEIF